MMRDLNDLQFFVAVVVVSFADPLIVQGGAQGDWHPIQGKWI
jgi:hypothetical protein